MKYSRGIARRTQRFSERSNESLPSEAPRPKKVLKFSGLLIQSQNYRLVAWIGLKRSM